MRSEGHRFSAPEGRGGRVPCAVETKLTGEGFCTGKESTCGRGGGRGAHEVEKVIIDAACVPRVSLPEVHPIRGFAHLCLASKLRFQCMLVRTPAHVVGTLHAAELADVGKAPARLWQGTPPRHAHTLQGEQPPPQKGHNTKMWEEGKRGGALT